MKATYRPTAGVLIAIAAILPPHAASEQGAVDPWKLIPAPATTCFLDDGFIEKLDTARVTIEAEIEKQKKINDAAKERFDNMDIMEKAQRMQAFMMKDPQAAMKMLQAEQAVGDAATPAVLEANASAARLEEERQRQESSFRAAIAAAAKPVLAKQDALIEAKTISVGEASVAMFTNAADHAQYLQLIAEENAAVGKACAPYFGPNGAFQKWITSYRTEVIDKPLSIADDTDIIARQMAAMDLPLGGYRSTTAMEQSLNYIRQMRNVWSVRTYQSKPRVELKK